MKFFAAACCVAAVFAACEKNDPNNGTNNIQAGATGIENGHEWVDLGLPSGLKWATCNVGATKPEEYGDYYAWGETTPKDYYDWNTYKYCADWNELTKYCTDSDDGKDGFADYKTILDLEDDAARVNWCGKWRMPTLAEWKELCENCAWKWTDDYNGTGVAGRIVTSTTNGNSIFLPAAGYRYNDELDNADDYGRYWSSSLRTDYPDFAWDVDFHSGHVYRYNYSYRDCGLSVRAVCE